MRWGWLDDPVMLAQLKLRDPRDFPSFTSTHRFLPIYQGEMDVNKNLDQTDGY